MSTTHTRPTSILTLIAIIVAARRSGDRQLERDALRELREAHGIRLSFARGDERQEASRAR
jgi:hypothetical protein